ncbi:hypothetical protein [Polaribacter cellanae]|uniref:Uncharacterized protein n=1 Tax=Polaribacter cellanae TaxID=2818493 RepID=A0A975CU53_9FLAO|nr:hypothetical protein [Polaribacter cellanae]QTE23501.1 hypothetical protein J3359_04260 [Polaribacter cellanae]
MNNISKFEKIGAKTALLIGASIGLVFLYYVIYFSLFPMLDFGIATINGNIFWNLLISLGLIPFTFILLLWKGGRKITHYISNGFSEIKSSFFFTLFINIRLFSLIGFIFIFGTLIKTWKDENVLGVFTSLLISLSLTTIFFLISTLFTVFTIGLLIVNITHKRILKIT